MSKIDLNSNEFDGTLIFNSGVAGVVENLKIGVAKKTPEDNEKAPDYRLKFFAKDGSTIDKAFYYLQDGDEKFADRLKRQGTEIKHLWGAIVGEEKIPEFKDQKDMLDKAFIAFHQAIEENADKLYRTVVDYGTNDYPQAYLRVQTFPPYLESMTVSSLESRLVLRKNARMTPFVPDKKEADYADVHTEDQPTADAGAAWS